MITFEAGTEKTAFDLMLIAAAPSERLGVRGKGRGHPIQAKSSWMLDMNTPLQ